MNFFSIHLPNEDATDLFGRKLGSLLASGHLLAIMGEMGAGKTRLARAIGEGMGLHDAVTSPTYSIVQEYRGAVNLIHIDAYRLSVPEDVDSIGFEEYLKRHAVIVIEWAERLAGRLPNDRLNLTMEAPDPSGVERRALMEAGGECHAALLDDLKESLEQ